MFFDTENEKGLDRGFGEVIPAGWHKATVESAEGRFTKDGGGRYIQTFFVTDTGRKLIHRFNVENKSDVARRIGRAEFKSLLAAAGVTTALASEAELKTKLVGKTVHVLIGIKSKNDGSGEKENVIKNYASKPPAETSAANPSSASSSLDSLPF